MEQLETVFFHIFFLWAYPEQVRFAADRRDQATMASRPQPYSVFFDFDYLNAGGFCC